MMMSYCNGRPYGSITAVILGIALFGSFALAQDAAWEGLINAGRNALQQQNYSEAERHFEAALEEAERFPSGDPRLGKSFNNLATVYYAQEDYARAEPLMRRALNQLQEALGPENTEVAQTMKNLAALYYLQGNRSEAEALLKQSLTTLEKLHGPNHAFVATILSNLAGLYQAENRYEDAEPLLTRSLAIWEGLLGADHPDVVRSRSLLVQIRQARGGNDRQEPDSADPKPLTALAGDAEGNTDGVADSDAVEEIARATNALEQLTRDTRAEADRANADAAGVPVPALNPIGGIADAEINVAVSPQDSEADQSQETTDSSTTSANADNEQAPNEIVTSALAQANTELDAAATILDDAASTDEVSFAVYLSTLWSVDEAQRYWEALRDVMPGILGDKQMELEVVVAAEGADPFYRVLTAPFSSDPEAQAACEQIKSKLRTHDCNVVVRGLAADG